MGSTRPMIQFKPYPIYANNPGYWEEVRQRQYYDFLKRGDKHMMEWSRFVAKRLYEIIPNPRPNTSEFAYERRVIDLLEVLGTTMIGRMLLSKLNKAQEYYILPLDLQGHYDCSCQAYTFPGKPKEGGGIRIYFHPNDFEFSPQHPLGSGDDVLFHELVHAYRIGRLGFSGQIYTPMNNAKRAEEFFALQMQNMYLSDRGSPLFYKTFNGLEIVSKSDAYDFLATDAEAIQAFRYFVETDKDPLAVVVSSWKAPTGGFNPFRDYPALEQRWMKDNGYPAGQKLMPFNTKFRND